MSERAEPRATIEDYDPARDNEQCLALERTAPQGEAFRLSFRRSSYHRRAENFDDHRLLVARLEGLVVGVAAVAFKDVLVRDEPRRAAFYFDMRVHPDHRHRGFGWRLAREIVGVGEAESDIGYCYIIDDNRAARALTWFRAKTPASHYHYLVYPTYRQLPCRSAVRESTMAEVHERLLATAPPFDFYTNPLAGGNLGGHVASWTTAGAACTAWTTRDILAEVVESLPARLRLTGRLLESWPVRLLPHPHVPKPGELLNSWYLTDVSGTTPADVAELVHYVSARARDTGIDYLYIPWVAGDDWIDTVRSGLPRRYTPELCYRFYAAAKSGSLPELHRIYVDIRDL